MQLLRDNLTLWTSSDGGEAEAAPAGETSKEAEKSAPTESKDDAPPRPTDGTVENHPAPPAGSES